MTVAPQTIISTVRHGQTVFGEQKRYAGSIDVPLSARGARECAQASRALAGSSFDVLITSPLRRAVDTGRLLSGHTPRSVQSDLCRERGFGIMEGLTWQEVQSLDPPILFAEVAGGLHSVNPQGGEPLEDVWERAKRFKRLIFREYRGSKVLVVSHGVFLQMFHGALRGWSCIESLREYPANLESTTFRFSGRRLLAVEVTDLVTLHRQDF